MGKIDIAGYILPVGILVAGYFVGKRFGLFGGGANADNNATIDANNKAAIQAALDAAKNSGLGQTVTDAQLNGLATSIYQMGVQSTPDQDGIMYAVIQVNTLTDLLRLMQLFGTKQVAQSWFDTCSLLGFNCQSLDLPAFLRAVLDASHIATINSYLSNQKINYYF